MKQLLPILLLLPLSIFAQKFKFNGYDKFLKQKVIETYSSTLKSGDNATAMAIKSVGTSFVISLKGTGAGAATIGSDDQAILLLDNDSTVIAKSVGVQTYELKDDQTAYKHEYAITRPGLEELSKHNLVGIRKYAFKNYVDIAIPQRNQGEVKKLSTLLLAEFDKNKTAIIKKNIKLEDVANFVGDSVTVCGKVFTARYLPNSNNKPTLLNMGAAYPDQFLTVVIYELDRNKFQYAPEVLFQDKDVCVTGRIELYNNKPQIIIHNKEQIDFSNPPKEQPVVRSF